MIIHRPFIEIESLVPTGCAWDEVGFIAFTTALIDGEELTPFLVLRTGSGGVHVYFGVGMPDEVLPRQLRDPETCARIVALVVEAVIAKDSAQ